MDVGTDVGPRSATQAQAPDRVMERTPDKNKLFLRLFLQNQRGLYAYVLTLLPNRADADDVLQETSLVMWDKFDANGPPNDFLAWGRRIAYHKILDLYKKTQRVRAHLSRIFVERIGQSTSNEAEALRQEERRTALAACIEKLPPRERDLLNRRFAEGSTTVSTSEQLGLSVDAVYKALARVRQSLFDCVERSLAREGKP
jgi:RNA polymerase sigma-70 factor, ECF subfamily